MNTDRRTALRVPLEVPIECHGFGDKAYQCLNHDVSRKGMCLRSNEPVEVGGKCRLVFALPHLQEKIEITGEVRWHSLESSEERIGIEFSEPLDVSVPFKTADQVVRSLRQDIDSYVHRLSESLSDACVWVNSSGEITRSDERFLSLLGYSGGEVEGRHLSEFAYADDSNRLSDFLVGPEKTEAYPPASGLFRMQPKDKPFVFLKLRALPPQPWMTSTEIWIEDMTESQVALGIYGGRKLEKLRHLPYILGAAATGFVLKDVLKQTSNPFTDLLGRLDLLRHKLVMNGKKLQAGNGDDLSYYVGETEKVVSLAEDLSRRLRYVQEGTVSLEPAEVRDFDINETLSKAITIARTYEGLNGDSVRFGAQAGLPTVRSNEQEFIMMFVIFLLLCRDCLKNVSDKRIACETFADNGHVVARMTHNGCIRDDRCLGIMLHSNPVESYFFHSDSVSCMDTLLHCGNLLMKKNNVKTKINNIPGQFSLSFLIPTTSK